MKLIEVQTNEQQRKFLELPLFIYQNDKKYIRPLDEDIERVFDPEKNQLLREGKCRRWLLQDVNGKFIGRIAAFINPLTFGVEFEKVGGMGFFECINSHSAANLLFEVAKGWLLEQGAEVMEGPINFGSRERWWGLLVDGFYSPCYCSNYNPPYYKDLFEYYGFKLYFKQYTYHRKVREPLKPALLAVSERVCRNKDYQFQHFKMDKLDKFAGDFQEVYNKAWVNHQGTEEMSLEQAKNLVYSLKPVIDEQIIWFAYYKNDPIGFFISLPELNELFVKYVGGKLDTFGKLRLLYNKWRGNSKTMFGLVFGIIPEYQRKGIEVALIVSAAHEISRKTNYSDIQMNWIGDFNPRMMQVAEQIGAKIYKTHHTYRYLFDRGKEFNRHPLI
ncbi:hypothetical protein [Desertivirga brevis]|uniref:hypothetical protein n=1 Tax=Desertivirga brevis TaxID=2810310 RepID=UPI001A96D0C4|nr:hypothetical protein [Pedobacter sp. SYSU D00873]